METTYNYTVFFGTAPDPPSGAYVRGDWGSLPEYRFTTGTKIVLVWAHHNRLVIRFAYTGSDFNDDIILWDAPQAEPLYMSVQAFQVQNYVSGSDSVYQVMGQW